MPQSKSKVRYAVVGLGHFAQVAVLPAFAATRNSELVALFSGDEIKRRELGGRYDVEHSLAYDEFDGFLARGVVDAVYLTVPNDLHKQFTLRAAQAGVHVLCEKPMAMDVAECREMIEACRARQLKLMIAYRLHFEPANLEVREIVRSGRLGVPRLFTGLFGRQVREDNVRTEGEHGGGPLYDIGIYCINAARSAFGEEPLEVTALASRKPNDSRFDEIEEQLVGALRFPSGRLAMFSASFGLDDVTRYEVFGTKGSIRVDQAFSYGGEIAYELNVGGRSESKRHGKRDQVAAEIIYFSECILEGREPEPSGVEGLCDMRVIDALFRSMREGRSVELEPFQRERGPGLDQAMKVRPHAKPDVVNAESPHENS